MPPLNLLIKPASGMCNLSCTYCFYHDIIQKRIHASYGFMLLETLEILIQKALAYADHQCTIAFQGGEPTLIGLPFFEQVVKLVEQYNTKKVKVQYALQTNGYKLSKEWAEFFFKHGFLIGLSIDGTVHSHDCHRQTPAGKGTFSEIMNTSAMFNNYKVDYNVLTVVNRRTAISIRNIYRFYKKNNFNYLQFIPCLDPFDETSGVETYSLSPEAYGRFLCELFDLWYEDFINGYMISIRNFDNYLSMLVGYPPESCDMYGQCGIQHVVESDGSIYPCDFFVLDNYRLGNVHTHDFSDFQLNRTNLKFIEESVITNDTCKKCSYYFLCRGGCKRHRMMADSSNFQSNYFCSSFQMFFAHAQDRLVKISTILQNRT